MFGRNGTTVDFSAILGVTLAGALALSAAAFEIDLDEVKGPDLWGGRKAHPAVVNAVAGQDPENVLSLRGEWEFMTRSTFGRQNAWGENRFLKDPKPWPHKVRVPACWEAQGIGQPMEMSISWNVKADDNPKSIRHGFMGVGCYRKKVAIPAAWRGKHIWLKVGGAKSVGWFYVNAQAAACVDNFCGTCKYDITDLVEPGKEAVVTAQVRNDVPSRKGLLSAMHRWGGLYRDVEIEATPVEGFIDDAWVRGDVDKGVAEAHVAVVGGSGMRVRFTVEGQKAEQPVGAGDEQVVRLALRNFRPWSPDRPNLYTGLVETIAADGRVVHARRERFGIRKIEIRGKEIYLNNKPFFVRGFGDDHVYPLTGITPADVNEHRRHLAVARKAGFNFVRLHTHTELPEYYEAADEMGILVEAEMPYYNDEPTEGQTFDPVRDATELWKNFRRHPSFAVYSMGNEGTFGPALDRAMHRYVKQMDPDRLKINQDCHEPKINPPESADFVGGPIKIWKRGSFNPERPFVTHEYMNLGAKSDARLEGRYTGVWMPPVPKAKRNAWLAGFGLDDAWGDRLQDAQHALQRVWQKRGIECARTDPYCDGFCYWTIVDVTVANRGTYSAQGLFNPFWEQKSRGHSAEEVRVFNSSAGVFCDLDGRVFEAGERVLADVRFADYGDAPFTGAALEWQVCADGKVLAEGKVPLGDLAFGAVRKIATLDVTMPAVGKATKGELRLAVRGAKGGARAENVYDCWLFPRRAKRAGRGIALADSLWNALADRYEGVLPESRAAEAEVVIAPYGSAMATEALRRGQKAITLAQCGGKPNVALGWWWMGSQVGTAFREHPALKALPHEGVLNELFFRIVKQGRKMPFGKGLLSRDLIAVGEGGDACYLYLAEARSAKGKALMAFGLDVLTDTPEGKALLDGFIDYVRSAAFAPAGEHEMKCLAALNGWAKTLKPGDRATWPGPMGEMNLANARGLAGLNELEWETQPVPADVRKSATFDFRFFGGQGYLAQPPVSFALFVNGKRAIDIPEVTHESTTWRQGGYALAYERDLSTEEYGTYTLTVPSAALESGKPARLKVVATVNNSRRWFSVQEHAVEKPFVAPVCTTPRKATKTPYTAGLFAQIPMEMLTDENREQYLKDVRDAGLEAVLLSFGDFYGRGETRRKFFARLAAEIKFFESAGLAVLVWTDTLGYGGNSRTDTPDGEAWFGGATRLTYLTGKSCNAYCPLDPRTRRYMEELTKDIARAGAKFFMVDDDYVQSARSHLGCCCERHLALMAERLGRRVTPAEIWASFKGAPNAVRTAFVDAQGRAAIETARRLRQVADEINPDMGMGLCLSYTHWDVEGADMDELLGALAGPRHQKLVRISGAPYWRDTRFNSSGLEGVIEFARMQTEWCKGRGWAVLDENDPYPRKVALVPAWRCELYDKATIADGLSARHKYMLCYGKNRNEPGYLEAHLADMPFDAPLRALFAHTEPYGVYVPYVVRQIREATLPTPQKAEGQMSEFFSYAYGSTLLIRSGIPVRHDPSPEAYALDAKALGVDLWTVDFGSMRPDAYRQKILDAAKAAGHPLAVYVETAGKRIYQLVRYNAQERAYSVLLENCGSNPSDIRIVTAGTPKIVGSVHGSFEARKDGVVVKRFPAHDWAAVKFTLAAE